MTAILERLDKESIEALHDICLATYLDGQCYEFAIALHRLTDWPLSGLMSGEVIRHALVNDGKSLRDVRGPISEKEVGSPFGILPPHDLRQISEDDIRAVRPVLEPSIILASKMIEVLWPDIPQKENCMRARLLAFAKDLERISHKHRLWIRALLPTIPPMIAHGEDDEGGYKLKPSADGMTYSIERYLQ